MSVHISFTIEQILGGYPEGVQEEHDEEEEDDC